MSSKMPRPSTQKNYPGRSHEIGTAVSDLLEEDFDAEVLHDTYQKALRAGWDDREIRVAILDYIEYILRNEVAGDYDADKVPIDMRFEVDEEGNLIGWKDGKSYIIGQQFAIKMIKAD